MIFPGFCLFNSLIYSMKCWINESKSSILVDVVVFSRNMDRNTSSK
uniref:Uncharacterized protein n=1 Tax=Nelumbo nucifera TaxID=4432 RepID=A0A822XNV6_NELNU|nr:TPA_asm: hypothetical protein HUJ06_022202 [Nelumbo nucifera]